MKLATEVDGAPAGDIMPAGEEFSARILDGQNDSLLTEAYRSAWNVFQSEAFLAAIERHMVTGSDRLVLVGVTDRAGDPVAVFPFVKRKRYGITVLEALDFGITDMFAPTYLRSEPLSAKDTKALWRTAVQAVPGVHAVSFKKMPRTIHKKVHALSGADFVKPMHASATTLFLEGGAGAADPKALGRKLKKAAKPLLKFGLLSFAEAKTREDIDACFAALVDFRTRRFEQLARSDALLDPNVVAFYRTLSDRCADQSLPGRIFALRAGAEVIAIAYGFAYRGAFTMIAPAFTPKKEFQVGSPGLVVMFKTLEWCLQEKFDVFDLSVGSLSYKSRFEADSIELFEHQEALTPLGLPVVLDGRLRRWIRDKARSNPKFRSTMERLRRVRSGRVREMPEMISPEHAGGGATTARTATCGTTGLRLSLRALRDSHGIAAEWSALGKRALTPNIFYEPEYAVPAAIPFGDGVQLLAVHADGGPLIGVWPFHVARMRWGVPLPLLFGWTHPFAATGVPLIDRDRAEGALTALFSAPSAFKLPRRALMPLVPDDSAFAGILAKVQQKLGLREARTEGHDRAFFTPRLAEDTQAHLSSSSRSKLRQELRRLEKEGAVTLHSAETPDDTARALNTYLDLEAKGWKGRAGTAIPNSEGEVEFMRGSVRNLAEQGRVRIDELKLGERVIASSITYRNGGTAWYAKISFDEEFSRNSPGSQLVLKVTEAMNSDPSLTSVDSCAPPLHPLMRRFWPERMNVSHRMLELGGKDTLFALAVKLEEQRPKARELYHKPRGWLKDKCKAG